VRGAARGVGGGRWEEEGRGTTRREWTAECARVHEDLAALPPRRLAGECGPRALVAPTESVSWCERAVVQASGRGAECRAMPRRSFTSAGERYTFFHFALLYPKSPSSPPPSSGLPPTAHRGARAAPRRVFLKGTQGRLSSAGSGSDKRGHAAPRASIAVAWGRRMLDAQVSIGTLLPCRFFKSCASMPSLS